jgi:hypothetical protein
MNEYWQVKEILDPTTGKVERLYSYKRKPCRRVLLNSKLAQQLAGYSLIEKDLRSTRSWLKEISARHVPREHKNFSFRHSRDRETYDLIKGLFVASLTFYGKCFTTCEGRRIKLDRSLLEEPWRGTHDEVLSYRNNFAAHSGAEKFEEVKIALVFPKRKPNVIPKIYRELQQPDLAWSGPKEGASFIELVEHVGFIVARKIQLLDEKILKEEVLPKGHHYWSKL